ncbi:PTS sugar transporter subunit IIB [Enterococcus asini]|uniref:PTS sugar transporter subunit IIB n=1 Tax=Enterococcus asini TaxID=57732 RepID=UPI001386A41C|nr:PTS sugar transporter subunit IIB [Enterococcus asini]MDT2745106.1 PTS sugar transporter subunit IIB [Enterococcus asini]
MIKLLRVDHRLLHGQVAFSWTTNLDVDCILVANDDVMVNDLRKTAIKLAKPSGVKLVIKSIQDSIQALNSGVTDKYNLLIVVESIADVKTLADNCPQIESINLGGTKSAPDKTQISKAIFLTENEKLQLKELLDKGIKIDIRMVPSDRKVDLETVL